MTPVELIILKIVGQKCFNELFDRLKAKNQETYKGFRTALEDTEKWFFDKYGDQYCQKNDCFFNQQAIVDELEKLTFTLGTPQLDVLSVITIQAGIQAPPEVVAAFLIQLEKELKKNPANNAVLGERDKTLTLHQIEINTGRLVEVNEKILAAVKSNQQNSGNDASAAYKPLDLESLYTAFKKRRLHLIPIQHIGEKIEGPEDLDLWEAYFEQDAGSGQIDLAVYGIHDRRLAVQMEAILKHAETWRSDLWRFGKEKAIRQINPDEIEHDFDPKKTVPVVKAFSEAARASSITSDPKTFEALISKTSAKLDTDATAVLTALSGFFQKGYNRKPVLTLLKSPCSCILIGDAGSGKTTAMRKLCLDAFNGAAQPDGAELPIPIFARLDSVAEFFGQIRKGNARAISQTGTDLLKFIQAHWVKDLENEDDLSEQSIRNCSQSVQLVLDGFDEIPSLETRRTIAKAVNHLVKKEGFNIIVTSRPAAIDKAVLELLDLPDYYLLELRRSQIRSFSDNFFFLYNWKKKNASKTDAARFDDALESADAALEFAGNPLYLTVMMLMHKKHSVLPSKRLDLYEAFVNMLLSQRQTIPIAGKFGDKPAFPININGADPIIWTDETYKKLLYTTAFSVHGNQDDSVSVKHKHIIQALKENRLNREVEGKNETDLAREFIDFSDEKLGLMVSRGPYHAFSHRSIQEYFAAMHLSKCEKAEIDAFWRDTAVKRPDRWMEVAGLLFCQIRDIKFCYEYLEELWPEDINRTQDPGVIQMIARALGDLQSYSKNNAGSVRYLYEGVKAALTAKRNDNLENKALFLACSDARGLIGSPEIQVENPPCVGLEAAAPFTMGYENDDEDNPPHEVTLSPFWVNRYPVTNREFAEFLKNDGYANENNWFDEHPIFGFDGLSFLAELKEHSPEYWHDEDFGKKCPLAPVVGVSWFEAMAYCRWWTRNYASQWATENELDENIIMRLATEAEWEFAAKGYDNRIYPWGDTEPESNSGHANLFYDLKKTTTVGSFPKGAATKGSEKETDTLLDMGGNVWEWCFDLYRKGFYKESVTKDPVNVSKGDYRVLRGGSWGFNAANARCANRSWDDPVVRSGLIGFRCVRTLK